MTITVLEHCLQCGCSALDDEAGRRPLPGESACGPCRCHTRRPVTSRAAAAGDAVGLTLLRALRARRALRV